MSDHEYGYEPEPVPAKTPGGQLALALSKAQGMIKGASKDSENPHFKSKYADLASVWEACREALSKNELAVIQTLSGGPDTITITTTLAHSSGEFVSDSLTLRPTKPDPQGIGSAATYGRRYGLAAIVGVAPEDDDGNAASQPAEKAKNPTKEDVKRELERQKPAKASYSLEDDAGGVTVHSSPDAFLDALGKLLKDSDDPGHAWTRNEPVISRMTEEAMGAKNEKTLGRILAAEKYANTRATELNP